jgi:hypothetical protein
VISVVTRIIGALVQEEKYNEVGSFEAALAAMQGAGQRVVSKRLIHPL